MTNIIIKDKWYKMALLEVKVFQRQDNSQIVNTLHYLAAGTPAAVTHSFGLMAALGFVSGITPAVGNVYTKWKDAVNNELMFTEVQAKDIYSATDFYVLPLTSNNAGALTNVAAPSFQCYALQTNRVRTDIRRGNRRLAGVDVYDIGDNGVIAGAQPARLQAVCDDMSATLTYDDEGNTLTYVPVVIAKQKYTTPSGGTAYQYYPTETEQLDHYASGVLWSYKDVVSTQNSRKRGRGR